MKKISELYHGRTKLEITYILLATSIISLIVAFIIGIADNFPGILLLYFGITVLIIAFVHHWREKKKFKILLIISILGIPLFAILHNLFYGLSKMLNVSTVLQSSFEILHVISFFIAIIICPVGLLVGALGLGLVGKRKESKDNIRFKKNIFLPWILGVVFGLFVSTIPIVFTPIYELILLAPYWMVGLFTASIIMGIIFQTPEWRWAIAVGIGLPITIIFKIISDSIFSIMDHNLFPIEIIISLFIAVISSFPGVYLGVLIKKIIRKDFR